jgi:hypothetical protein
MTDTVFTNTRFRLVSSASNYKDRLAGLWITDSAIGTYLINALCTLLYICLLNQLLQTPIFLQIIYT